jgi:hypothetical protein
MFARKFLDHIGEHREQLTGQIQKRIAQTGRCDELLRRVPADEQKEAWRTIYRDITEWLLDETKPVKSEYYVALGKRRAEQGVPFRELLAAVCSARQYFWDYIESETLLDQPADFWGSVKLLRSLDNRIDSVLYFALLGYLPADDVGGKVLATRGSEALNRLRSTG